MWSYRSEPDCFIAISNNGMVRFSDVMAFVEMSEKPDRTLVYLRGGEVLQAMMSPAEFQKRIAQAIESLR